MKWCPNPSPRRCPGRQRATALRPPPQSGARRQRTMAAHKRSHRAWGREATRAPSGQRRALNPHRHSSRMAPRPGRGRHARISCRPDTGVRMGGGAVEASSPGTEGMRSRRGYRLVRSESSGLKRGQRGPHDTAVWAARLTPDEESAARGEKLRARLRGQRQALVPYRQSGRIALGPGRGRHARSSCLPEHGDVLPKDAPCGAPCGVSRAGW